MTKPGTLAGIFVVGAIVGWLATRATFTSLPLLPYSAVPALAALALAETAVGRSVHVRVTGRRPGVRRLAPLAVARLVALAKATSTAAAGIGGLVGGYLAYVLAELDKSVPARDARVAGINLAAALALLAAGVYLEHCCRAPRPPDESDDEKQRSKESWQWHS